MKKINFEVISSRESDEEDIKTIQKVGKEYGIDIEKSQQKIIREAAESLPPIFVICISFVGLRFAEWALTKSFDAMWNNLQEFLHEVDSEDIDSSISQLHLNTNRGKIEVHIHPEAGLNKQLTMLGEYLKRNTDKTALYFEPNNEKWLTIEEVRKKKRRK